MLVLLHQLTLPQPRLELMIRQLLGQLKNLLILLHHQLINLIITHDPLLQQFNLLPLRTDLLPDLLHLLVPLLLAELQLLHLLLFHLQVVLKLLDVVLHFLQVGEVLVGDVAVDQFGGHFQGGEGAVAAAGEVVVAVDCELRVLHHLHDAVLGVLVEGRDELQHVLVVFQQLKNLYISKSFT